MPRSFFLPFYRLQPRTTSHHLQYVSHTTYIYIYACFNSIDCPVSSLLCSSVGVVIEYVYMYSCTIIIVVAENKTRKAKSTFFVFFCVKGATYLYPAPPHLYPADYPGQAREEMASNSITPPTKAQGKTRTNIAYPRNNTERPTDTLGSIMIKKKITKLT